MSARQNPDDRQGEIFGSHPASAVFCRVEFFSSRCVLPVEKRYQDLLNREIPQAANQQEKDVLTRALCHSLKVYITHACGGC